ncbi:transcription factor [Fusarium longipes]|uniref:Transcription factor n=1 Tax=Fusarium longipes TaxID=694270 RepID=A0A395SM79_9HYPO|nr:transcription factor [Fusarium longipes]
MGDQISLDNRHSSIISRPLENESAPAPKRRKLRKGTQSCWECKRRKAKCIYSDHLGICDSCKRRGTDCVSQDVDENPPPQGSNKHIVDRLGEVEALVQHLLKASQNEKRSQERPVSPESLRSRRWSFDNELTRSISPTILPHQADTDNIDDGSVTVSRDTYVYDLKTNIAQNIVTSLTAGPEISPSFPVEASPGPYDDLYTELVAAWPNSHDMKVILDLPVEPSQIIRALTCAPPKDRTCGLPSPKNLLRLPPRGSHPVLVARKLLIMATYLQGVPIASEKHLDKLSLSCDAMMDRLVKVAHDKVTCNDDLVSSLEGIECIMLQGLYANYTGDLRRSWLAARRAVMIAQMMGLNKGIAPFSYRDVTIDTNDLWFRIINFDRYLCLMLGLPQSSPDEPLPPLEELESYPSNRKLQNLCSVACGKLLNRKPSQMYDQTITEDIDKLLRDACTTMPAQWWVMPALGSYLELPDKIRETLRFNDHFMQYHLLLQLHMPYILKVDTGESFGYNKLTAITASREILTRFISVRIMPQTKSYCRGTDLIAFMASTALTLGHILCDHRHKRIDDQGFHFLTQQRLSDRGLLEQVLSIAENKVHGSGDDIAKRLTTLLHYLLAIEDNVGAGVRYHVTFAEDAMKDGSLGHHVKANNDGTLLEIHLPHYPMIKISRRDPEGTEPLPVLMELPWGLLPTNERVGRETDVTAMAISGSGSPAPDAWTLEGFDMSFLDSFIEGPAVI